MNVVVLGASKEDSTIDFGLTGKNGKVLSLIRIRKTREQHARHIAGILKKAGREMAEGKKH